MNEDENIDYYQYLLETMKEEENMIKKLMK